MAAFGDYLKNAGGVLGVRLVTLALRVSINP